ncbi:endonuclease [Polaribacter aestuariivivens]|uniref:Endonuclease n=1 Tax=Polaribacter aestuariivivens TaxID=2304626 RepID=A0A5S3N8D7_9FLAO|nr:endonuclease/exonuclease/phosphatase family protein [Polaribacter aestuariivivens]TMM29659.1 endonuclease [Polaribacter aestuariivivens]
MFPSISSRKQSEKITTIAFYNVENLFDTINDPKTLDDDYTVDGKHKWTKKRYSIKLKKLGSVISQLGLNRSKHPPAIVGLVEVENAKVVHDLVNSSYLKKYHYDFVHHDSPDERGIDVALLYNKKHFEVLGSETFALKIENEPGVRDYTRDVLKITGNLHGELVYILVNHWPSRRDGAETTEYKRIKAAELNRTIIDEIRAQSFDAKIIIMGDFNDDPASVSIQTLASDDFINPMENLLNPQKTGSTSYNKKWNLFDQILFSKNFLEKKKDKLYFKHAEVFNKKWLKVFKGKLKGSPFRTYIGPWYQGGFSDHFPVYAFLKKED